MGRVEYRTTTVEELYANGAEPRVDLYVYSTTNNPDGAGVGTDAHYIGTADSYSYAHDLWDAARAATCAIYGKGGDNEIGLCVKAEARSAADVELARYAAVFAADAGTDALYYDRITEEVEDLAIAVASEAIRRRDAADAANEDFYPLAFVEGAAMLLNQDHSASLKHLFDAGQTEVNSIKQVGE